MQIVLKMSDVLSVFKYKTRIAKEIGITKQAVSQWGETIPNESALILVRKNPTLPHTEINKAA